MVEQADEHPELPVDPAAPDASGAPHAPHAVGAPDAFSVAGASRALRLRASAVALVAVGGFAGTGARYWLARLRPAAPGHWPWGTFIANILGAVVLGALLEGLARGGPDAGWRQRIRLLLGTGFCGAFTTYSSLAVEADLLVADRHGALAAGYLLASLGIGFVASVAGVAAAAGRHRRRRRRSPWHRRGVAA